MGETLPPQWGRLCGEGGPPFPSVVVPWRTLLSVIVDDPTLGRGVPSVAGVSARGQGAQSWSRRCLPPARERRLWHCRGSLVSLLSLPLTWQASSHRHGACGRAHQGRMALPLPGSLPLPGLPGLPSAWRVPAGGAQGMAALLGHVQSQGVLMSSVAPGAPVLHQQLVTRSVACGCCGTVALRGLHR